jgi:hypothetical protein
MVITVWTILITLFISRHILPKRFLTLLAHEHHLRRLGESMRLAFGMAFGTVIPSLAARSSYGDLSV